MPNVNNSCANCKFLLKKAHPRYNQCKRFKMVLGESIVNMSAENAVRNYCGEARNHYEFSWLSKLISLFS